MLSKFLAVFGYIVLYMVIWALLLLPVALLLRRGGGSGPLTALLVMTALIFILFLPYLNITTRRIFHFPGEGLPITEAALREELLTVNEFDAPVMVTERGDKLIFTWRYVDARWWELLSKAGLTQIYELHVKLDDERKTAVLIDVTKSVSWRAGPEGVNIGMFGFRGVNFSYEVGKAWGIRENFTPGKIYDYKFSPQEIKNPVLNSILQNGWQVRFGMW